MCVCVEGQAAAFVCVCGRAAAFVCVCGRPEAAAFEAGEIDAMRVLQHQVSRVEGWDGSEGVGGGRKWLRVDSMSVVGSRPLVSFPDSSMCDAWGVCDAWVLQLVTKRTRTGDAGRNSKRVVVSYNLYG